MTFWCRFALQPIVNIAWLATCKYYRTTDSGKARFHKYARRITRESSTPATQAAAWVALVGTSVCN